MKDLIWYQRPEARLDAWRDFRQSLDDVDLLTALTQTTLLWSFAPFVTYYLDPARPAEWPNPWLLLSENYYCDLAKTLGMFYTIALTKHGVNNLVLKVMYDSKRKEQVNVVVVNDKHIINYHFNGIVNIDAVNEDCITRHIYDKQQLGTNNYH